MKKDMSVNKQIQLGLCCLNTELRKKKNPVFCSRRVILKTIEKKGMDALFTKIKQNVNDLTTMIEWNEQHGIKVFRVSSEMFPHKSNPKAPDYDFTHFKEGLKKAGDLARKYNQRITMHPGHFNCIGSPSARVFENTKNDLEYHAELLDCMGMGKNSVMVIHGGGVYGDKKKTKQRWCEQFMKLEPFVRNRIVLENCEKNFNIEDCLEISQKVGVPVVFDTHHFECYKQLHPKEPFQEPYYYIPLILNTWKRRGIKPKFHVSEQGKGRCGHHSDFIESIPDYLLSIPSKHNIDIDIYIEAKMKEQAIFKLYKKYPFLNCLKLK